MTQRRTPKSPTRSQIEYAMKIILALTALFIANTALAEDIKLTGAWNMKALDIKQTETVIVRSNDNVTVLARVPTEKWTVIGTGTVNKDKVTLEFSKAKAKIELSFDGNKTLSGKDHQNAAVTIQRLSSLYVCNNHSPTNHAAASLSEMRGLTQQYHCTGWHSGDAATGTTAKINLVERLTDMPATK